MKNEKFVDFDAAEMLETDEDIVIFLADALETGNVSYIAHALGIVTRARGIAQIANETGLSRKETET